MMNITYSYSTIDRTKQKNKFEENIIPLKEKLHYIINICLEIENIKKNKKKIIQ